MEEAGRATGRWLRFALAGSSARRFSPIGASRRFGGAVPGISATIWSVPSNHFQLGSGRRWSPLTPIWPVSTWSRRSTTSQTNCT